MIAAEIPVLSVDITGMAEALGEVQRLRDAITNRGPMHAAIAGTLLPFTQEYVVKNATHKNADRLGAQRTGFRDKAADTLGSGSDDEFAFVSIPRVTGLGRAFYDVTIRPGSGRKYLTIPECAETYGHVARDFGKDAFKFSFSAELPDGSFVTALVWTESSGKHEKGDVAYSLWTEIGIKQDRTLLPRDEDFERVGRETAQAYLAYILKGETV